MPTSQRRVKLLSPAMPAMALSSFKGMTIFSCFHAKFKPNPTRVLDNRRNLNSNMGGGGIGYKI